MKTYKVSLVGTGMIMNGAHIPALQHLNGRMEVVAVCDERIEAAKFTANKLGVPYFTDCTEMLDSIESDILINCTCNASHTPLALLGLEKRRHVITEKPVSLKVADVRKILETSDRTGKQFFPTQTGRFTNNSLMAKKWIQEGQLGDVYFIDLNIIRRRGIPQWGQFHIKEKNDGGAFADMGVHNVDAVLDFCGNPLLKSARATFYSRISKRNEEVQISNKESGALDGTFVPRSFDMNDMSVEEFAVGTIHLERDITISFRVSWALNLPEEGTFKIVGDSGGLIMPSMHIYKTIGGCMSEVSPKVFDNTSNAVPDWGHWVCYERILDALDGRSPYPVTREQMLNTAAILEAVYKSAALDREVTAKEIPGLGSDVVG